MKFLPELDDGYLYAGRILNGHYDPALKKRLSKTIAYMDALDEIGTPIVPYIAAWKPNTQNIWYEYASKRLKRILEGEGGDQLAEAFRNSLSRQYMYQKHFNSTAVQKNILDKIELAHSRQFLRKLAERTGKSEAIYQIDTKEGSFWLKDIALIETYLESDIIISIGSLIDVTNEIKLEEELTRTKDELENQKQDLEKMVEKRSVELHDTQVEVVDRLVQAAEYRDNQTGLHNKRLSRYSAIIGKNYGLKKDGNWLLYQAVPMHDVGKIGIPDNILLKAGKLTPEEYDIMKTHCQLGHNLLDGGHSKLLTIAKTIALTHHEHWDGSGYPFGLAGNDIPLTGRITAICDVFDALTSERPYKDAWKIEEAVEEIIRLRGSHFDPKLVDIFIKSVSAIGQVYEEFAEEKKVSGK